MASGAPVRAPGTGKSGLCGPAKAGAGAGAATGLVVWLLVSFIPQFHSGVPEPVVAVLPFVLGWLGHTAASWITPHEVSPAADGSPAPGSGSPVTTPSGGPS